LHHDSHAPPGKMMRARRRALKLARRFAAAGGGAHCGAPASEPATCPWRNPGPRRKLPASPELPQHLADPTSNMKLCPCCRCGRLLRRKVLFKTKKLRLGTAEGETGLGTDVAVQECPRSCRKVALALRMPARFGCCGPCYGRVWSAVPGHYRLSEPDVRRISKL
jgi:hypothetical protein